LVDRHDGSQTLTFKTLPGPPDHTWPTHDEGVDIDHEVEVLIGLVLAGLIIILTDGAAAVVGVMIVGLLVGAMQVSTQIIETVHESDAPRSTSWC
jgi:hypothetical protein